MKTESEFRNFWKDTAETHLPTTIQTNDSIKKDIIIIGSGIAALTTALVLQQEGKHCIVVSPVNLADANLKTGNLTTIPGIQNFQSKNITGSTLQLLAKSKREAIDLVEGLINKYNIDCDFRYLTGYLFAQTDSQATLLEQTEAMATEAGVISTETNNLPLSLPFKKAYRFDFQAQLHPLKYLAGLAAAFKSEGGVIWTGCTVTKVEDNSGITVHTSSGTLHAQQVIYTGDDGHLNKTPFKGINRCCYNIAFILKEDLYPEGISYDMSAPGHSFSTFAADGQKYVVATGFENNDSLDGQAAFSELEKYLCNFFNIERVTHKWMSEYHIGANGLPNAGRMPGQKDIYVISALGNNAIVNGSIAAKIVCSLIYNKHSGYEKLYNPRAVVQDGG